MTKIKETVHFDNNDRTMIVQETHDFTPVLERAAALRSAGQVALGKPGPDASYCVGLVPLKMWHEWAKKWGVKPSDTKAMREVVLRELNDSDNAHLRVWGGRV